MLTKVEISAADIICLELLIEEGIFVQRIMHQHNTYPHTSSILALTVIPFLALIEHDSIPYLEKKFGFSLPKENADLIRIRHKTKSIDSRYLNYQKYREEAARIIEASRRRFREKGIARLLPPSFVKDIGISYFEGMPIYSTFSVANVLDDENGSLWSNSKEYCSSVGYNAGSACAFHYCLAEEVIKDKRFFLSNEFTVTANDHIYSSLVKKSISRKTNDEYVFFFLSEQLLRLSSIQALRKSGFLEKTIWLKLATVYLFHAYKAIGSFIGVTHKPPQKFIYSQILLSECSGIFSRDEKKQIRRMKKLRNAFVHYDFEDLISTTMSNSRNFDLLLEAAINSTMKMDFFQYEFFLSNVVDKAIMNLKAIIGFPEYDPKCNIFAD